MVSELGLGKVFPCPKYFGKNNYNPSVFLELGLDILVLVYMPVENTHPQKHFGFGNQYVNGQWIACIFAERSHQFAL